MANNSKPKSYRNRRKTDFYFHSFFNDSKRIPLTSLNMVNMQVKTVGVVWDSFSKGTFVRSIHGNVLNSRG